MGSYAAELQDPSATDFCLLVTGITTTLGGLSSGACLGFEEAEILDIDTCTIEFCDKGVDGFEDFLTATFKYIRKNLLLFACIMGVFGIGESTLFVVSTSLVCLHVRHGHEPQKADGFHHVASGKTQYTGKFGPDLRKV